MLSSVVLAALSFTAPVAHRATSGISMMADKSASIPFLPKPEGLDGSMAGDVGFVRAHTVAALRRTAPG